MYFGLKHGMWIYEFLFYIFCIMNNIEIDLKNLYILNIKFENGFW